MYARWMEQQNKIRDRETRILESDASMLQYYSSIINVREKSSIYRNFVDDRKRYIITRWRLSNHKLLIETGRYHIPYIERMDRKCWQCNVVEDERHPIYVCPAFLFIRENYQQLLTKYQTVKDILNPERDDIYAVADFLSDINTLLDKR